MFTTAQLIRAIELARRDPKMSFDQVVATVASDVIVLDDDEDDVKVTEKVAKVADPKPEGSDTSESSKVSKVTATSSKSAKCSDVKLKDLKEAATADDIDLTAFIAKPTKTALKAAKLTLPQLNTLYAAMAKKVDDVNSDKVPQFTNKDKAADALFVTLTS